MHESVNTMSDIGWMMMNLPLSVNVGIQVEEGRGRITTNKQTYLSIVIRQILTTTRSWGFWLSFPAFLLGNFWRRWGWVRIQRGSITRRTTSSVGFLLSLSPFLVFVFLWIVRRKWWCRTRLILLRSIHITRLWIEIEKIFLLFLWKKRLERSEIQKLSQNRKMQGAPQKSGRAKKKGTTTTPRHHYNTRLDSTEESGFV